MSKITTDNVGGIDRRRFLTMVGVAAAGLALRPGTAEARPEKVNNSLFSITGVPDSVNSSTMEKKANEAVPATGDVIHKNETLLGTEHWLAEPGNRTYSSPGVTIDGEGKKRWSEAQAQIDLEQEQAGACWQTSEYRETFTHDHYPFLTPEGGFVVLTGAGMDLSFPDGQSPAEIHLGAREGHSWMVIMRGLPRDYQIDADKNVMIDAHNLVKPGAVNGTKLPPGQYVSEKYFLQNAATEHGKSDAAINCGTDGCSGLSALFFNEKDGAYTWINQAIPDAPFTLVQTNIK